MTKDDPRIYDKPGHLIRRLQQISLALFMDETKAFEITPVQYAALAAIDSHPGLDQTELCHLIAIDRSTVGDVVTRLERKKLIRRTAGIRGEAHARAHRRRGRTADTCATARP